MTVLVAIIGLMFIHYLWLIEIIRKKLTMVSDHSIIENRNKISIIIPFRNESENLETTISSLENLNYDSELFEIIFVNDHSEDDFSLLKDAVEKKKNWQLINSLSTGKKEAIKNGILISNSNWIIVSDADCIYDPNWLVECDKLIIKYQSDLYVLPVFVKNSNAILENFQYYDSLSTLAFNQGFFQWKGQTLLASGANMLFNKNAFLSIDPFKNNKAISSGDDMFLLEAFKKTNKSIIISSNRGLWVETKGQSSWMKVIDQRIRWAKKMRFLSRSRSFLFGVYMLFIQLGPLIILLSSLESIYFIGLFFIFILSKAIVDYRLISKMASFNNLKTDKMMVFILEFVYIFIVPLIVILSIFRNPLWKGRKISS